MKSELNSNILGMVSNVWNLSCDCEKGHVFRFDVERCVDHNECADDENEEEICSAGGYSILFLDRFERPNVHLNRS